MKYVVVYLSLLFWITAKGSTALIQTDYTVVSAVGDEACLKCRLQQLKDVRQVTWQKMLPDVDKNVATYSDAFGQNVNRDFRDKVKFKDAGLQSCSIVIMEVTEQDEGCYLCLFNSYPDGALTGTTCLHVYELHEAVLHVRESNSPEESVVSCSATGRPAPTVTLSVTQADVHFSDNNTVSVTNTNRTVTVNATAVISGLRGNRVQVTCTVRVLSVQKDVFMMIPEVKPTSADEFDEESENRHFIWTWIVVAGWSCVVIIIIIIIIMFKHRNNTRNLEMNEMIQPTNTEPDMTEVFLDAHENNQIRKRSPKEKKPESVNIQPSCATARRLSFDCVVDSSLICN